MSYRFRGCRIIGISERCTKGVFLTALKFTADVTPELCEQMGWDTVYKPDGTWTRGASVQALVGEMPGDKLKLSWNENEKVAIQIEATEARSFALVRKTKQESTEVGLRFQVLVPFSAVEAFRVYWQQVVEGVSHLILGTDQQELDFGGGEAAAAAESDASGPALGSALQVVGGGSTAELKKRRQVRCGGDRMPSGAVMSEESE